MLSLYGFRALKVRPTGLKANILEAYGLTR